ncbi:MAG: ISAs1 family transposase [Anaerolineae bacterium]|nr:ISAs1 family transposase [Anaerolineae bacterium]
MKPEAIVTLETHFGAMQDPRISSREHKLIEIIIIAICAVICGANDWVGVETFGKAKAAWLRTFLELPNGIPSHDSFGRVFRQLDPEQFERSFVSWIQAICTLTAGEIVAVDGKQLRRSHDRILGKGAIHMVSAWASVNHLVLGQRKVDAKSNEITAIPELLKALTLKGCIVTIDAMGCQTAIAQTIIDKEADYFLALKENQPNLYKDVQLLFDDLAQSNFTAFPYDHHKTVDKGHGRIEVRQAWVLGGDDIIPFLHGAANWQGFGSVVKVQAERYIGETASVDTRYYIASPQPDAKLALHATRTHWSVENSLHWRLDIAFREDDARLRKDHGPHNFAILRHLALNILTKDTSANLGFHNRRLRAACDELYLAQLLNNAFT